MKQRRAKNKKPAFPAGLLSNGDSSSPSILERHFPTRLLAPVDPVQNGHHLQGLLGRNGRGRAVGHRLRERHALLSVRLQQVSRVLQRAIVVLLGVFVGLVDLALGPVAAALGAVADVWGFQPGILVLGVLTVFSCGLIRGLGKV